METVQHLEFPDLSNLLSQSPDPLSIPQITSIADHKICIRGLPDYPGYKSLNTTPLARLVHRLKKLWRTGDRLGQLGLAQRRDAGYPCEKLPLNCRTTFVYLFKREGDQVIISLLFDHHQSSWVDEQGECTLPTTATEQAIIEQYIITMIVGELTAHFRNVHAAAGGRTPDYWGAPLPALPYPY